MSIYEEFINVLDTYNKEESYGYAIELLNNCTFGVVDLYEKVLKPSLNN